MKFLKTFFCYKHMTINYLTENNLRLIRHNKQEKKTIFYYKNRGLYKKKK